MRTIIYLTTFLSLFNVTLQTSESDFYNLLSVERSSDLRTIRKAFKKLALTLHPDKNPDNDKAHEQFLAINRAYEVLKDDDLRKIYDEFGHAGLNQHENRKDNYQRYQSWSYYNEFFGIYDNDDDIITLSRSDFEQFVHGKRQETIWFINFYSPRCSHCHTLAPEWRKLASILHHVIRIGAVNCAEDRELCQNEGIRSYPSLILYPDYIKFDISNDGDRDHENLLKFVMKNLKIKLKRFDDESIKELDEKSTNWNLISVCVNNKQCLSQDELTLLANKFNQIMPVSEIVCNENSKKICQSLRLNESKLILSKEIPSHSEDYILIEYSSSESDSKHDQITNFASQIESIFQQVAHNFPNVEPLSVEDRNFIEDCLFGNKNKQCKEKLSHGWVLAMFRNEKQYKNYEIELKLLSHLMKNHKIIYVLCENDTDLKDFCLKFSSKNDQNYPKLNTLKFITTGSYEKYYGRFNAIDILNFALDSFESQLRILNSEEFENVIVKDKVNAHLVQFFSPRCPACKVAQQKLRKLSHHQFTRPVSFGVIDCGVYFSLCKRYNIQSYPTVLLYNNTVPHQYVGKFTHDKPIIDFIQFTLHSDLVEIKPDYFKKHISNSKVNRKNIWLVSFSSPFCYICQVLSPTLRKLSTILSQDEDGLIKVGSINCNEHRTFCAEQQIQSYPTIRLFPSSEYVLKNGGSFFTFKNRRDFHMLRSWIYDYVITPIKEIDSSSDFKNIISDDTPTIINFYSPWAFSSRRFDPEFNRLSRQLKTVRFRRVSCEDLATLCDQLKIHFYPTLRFYSGDKSVNDEEYRKGIHIQIPDLDDVEQFDLNKLSQAITELVNEKVSTTKNIKTEL